MDHKKSWLHMPADIDWTQPSVACNSDALIRRKNPITDCQCSLASGLGPTHGIPNRELIAADGARTGLGPPFGGAWVACRFGLFLTDKSAFPQVFPAECVAGDACLW